MHEPSDSCPHGRRRGAATTLSRSWCQSMRRGGSYNLRRLVLDCAVSAPRFRRARLQFLRELLRWRCSS
eukprot:4692245-Pyramimonas_sp.AAC.1